MTKRMTNRVAWGLALTVVAAGLVGVAAAVHRANAWLEALPSLAGGCGEDLHTFASSPNRKYVAALFVRNCGATTPFVTHVNLRESSHAFSLTPHDTIEDGEVFMREGEGSVKLVWKDSTHLVIEGLLTEVSRQESTWRDVTITYRPSRK